MPLTVVVSRYLEIAAKAHEAVKQAVNETCKEIEQDVKGRAPKAEAGGSTDGGARSAPVITGNLRRSYHTEFVDDSVGRIEAQVGNDMDVADYAGFVEFGTSRMAPRPHLTPSSEAQRLPHAARIAAAVRAAEAL